MEIVIVLVLIGLVLTMVAKLGSGFSDKIRFASTKESLVQAVEHVIQEAATTSNVRTASGNAAYGSIFLSLTNSGTRVERTYLSGDLAAPVTGSTLLENGIILTTGFALTLKPYAVGCAATSGTEVRVARTPRPENYIACYKIDTATCKLREKSCN